MTHIFHILMSNTQYTLSNMQKHNKKIIREMEGTIQLKKYRTMRRRYGEGVDVAGETSRIGHSVNDMLK